MCLSADGIELRIRTHNKYIFKPNDNDCKSHVSVLYMFIRHAVHTLVSVYLISPIRMVSNMIPGCNKQPLRIKCAS